MLDVALSFLADEFNAYLLRRTYCVQPGDTVLIHAAAGGVGDHDALAPGRGRARRAGDFGGWLHGGRAI